MEDCVETGKRGSGVGKRRQHQIKTLGVLLVEREIKKVLNGSNEKKGDWAGRRGAQRGRMGDLFTTQECPGGQRKNGGKVACHKPSKAGQIESNTGGVIGRKEREGT